MWRPAPSAQPITSTKLVTVWGPGGDISQPRGLSLVHCPQLTTTTTTDFNPHDRPTLHSLVSRYLSKSLQTDCSDLERDKRITHTDTDQPCRPHYGRRLRWPCEVRSFEASPITARWRSPGHPNPLNREVLNRFTNQKMRLNSQACHNSRTLPYRRRIHLLLVQQQGRSGPSPCRCRFYERAPQGLPPHEPGAQEGSHAIRTVR